MQKSERLWSPGFTILWQSQLVSMLGDAVYAIALGFWVLSETGSTALMGTLMAVSTLPGVLVSPFAGVLIDRSNKKALMIAMDLIRGAAVLLLSLAAYNHLIKLWMVFAAGIVLSVCGAVFQPGISSAIPDIVPASKITNANSAFSLVMTGANLIGNAAGGFLYQLLGAPLLFLTNGITFIFSGACLPFVKLPNVKHREKPHFFEDMAEGFRYMWRQTGLKVILCVAACSNFFSFVAITLLVPFCKFTPGLGSAKYGILMASFMGGAVIGYILLSVLSVKARHKMTLYILSSAACFVLLIGAINQPYFLMMVVLLILAGITNAIMNVLLTATVQTTTPATMRGKVMAFMSTTTSGLTPFAMALGGILGGFLPVKLVITGAFVAALLTILPSYASPSFKLFLTSDIAETPE